MKRLMSLKQLLSVIVLISSLIVNPGCKKELNLSSTPNSTQRSFVQTSSSLSIGRVYLDLSQDQMVPGGITDEMLKKYMEQGFVLKTLDQDLYCYHVSFKDKNGNIYYRNGWVKSGSKYIERTSQAADPIEDFWYECANAFSRKN